MLYPRTVFPLLGSNPARLPSWLIAALVVLLGSGVATSPARAQPAEWKQVLPTARFDHAMAYDSDRHVTVLFGGVRNEPNNVVLTNGETWEWNGTAWNHRVVSGPSPRYAHAMVYDSVRHVTVLFGGTTSSAPSDYNGETWEWNGNTWTQRHPSLSPSPRHLHAMAFDVARGVTVLFGGFTGQNQSGTDYVRDAATWEWDGTNWTQRQPSVSPTGRAYHAMAYDSLRQVTVLFGGDDGDKNRETWEWNGTAWTLRCVCASGPAARYGHAMAYDSDRDVTVLFAGFTGDAGNGAVTNDLWEWNGAVWAQHAQQGGPTSRYQHRTAYDSFRHVLVLFGGHDSPDDGDTWEWNGTGGGTWAQQTSNGPSPRFAHAVVFDSAQTRQAPVLFGGVDVVQGSVNGETWEWRGGAHAWTQRHPTLSPSPRGNHTLSYDVIRGSTVLFGGQGEFGNDNGDTWEWDGTTGTWALRDPGGPGRPSPRYAHASSYDLAGGATVLFGGYDHSNAEHGDTWKWDGSSWALLDSGGPGRPSPRHDHAMVYDAARHVMVLFGGATGGNSALSGETWEWSGTTGSWTLRDPGGVGGPSARFRHAMAYDMSNHVTVLFGGITNSGVNGETWEWNGTTGAWTLRDAGGVARPSPRWSASMVYDSSRSEVLLFGGYPYSDELWALRTNCLVPTITSQPSAAPTCPSGPAAFAVTAAGGHVAYQWQYKGGPSNPNPLTWTDLVEGRNPPTGAFQLNAFNTRTRLLVVDHDSTRWPDPVDHTPYVFRCELTNTCGSTSSVEAAITLPEAPCAGDFNGDCNVDFFDYLDFVDAFSAQAASADFNGDSSIDFFDYLDFIDAFSTGC